MDREVTTEATTRAPSATAVVLSRLRRLRLYVGVSYPPAMSVLFSAAWAYGLTSLFAATDPRISTWRPGINTALCALTLLVDMLLMRAVDDIRDLTYDRRFNPRRPLASGAVRSSDLAWLFLVGTVVLVLINLGDPWPLAILLIQLIYAALLLATQKRLGLPHPDNLTAGLLSSIPVPVLLHLYLYACYLRVAHLTADRHGVIPIVIVVLAAGHPEVAKKIVRHPYPAERAYSASWGLRTSITVALLAPIIAVVLAVISQVHANAAWDIVLVAPLLLPALGLRRFAAGVVSRWPPAPAVFFLLSAYLSYLVTGLISVH